MLSRATALSHGVLLFATTLTSITYEQSSLPGRPIQSSILILFISGLTILFFRNLILRTLFSFYNNQTPSVLPLLDARVSDSDKDFDDLPTEQRGPAQPLTAGSKRLLTVSAAVAVSLRIEVSHGILGNRQCKISSVEGCVPLLLAIHDYWYIQRRRPKEDRLAETNEPSKYSLEILGSNGRNILPALCLGVANALQSYVFASPRSTYICPLSSSARVMIPLLQIVSTLLDCYVLLSLVAVVRTPICEEPVLKTRIAPAVLAHVFLLSSAFLFLGGTLALVINSVYWVELSDIGWSYAGSIVGHSILLTAAIIAVLHISVNRGLFHFSMFVLGISTYSTGLAYAWADNQLLSGPDTFATVAFLLLLFLGSASYLHVESVSGSRSRHPSQRPVLRVTFYAYIVLAMMVIFLGWSQRPAPRTVFTSHPIDMLMSEASEQAKDWLGQASRSETLTESAEEYLRRYRRYPPPGFDAWYRYATEKSSIIIDDYDTIMEDLEPFWGITPARIRLRTREVISDPWNEVSEVKIRSGHARLGPNFLPTHRWMLDGVVELVQNFSQFLPDMDLAFNLNDEPRVAVPYQEMEKLRNVGIVDRNTKHQWSANRAKGWETPEDAQPQRLFEDHSRTNAFSEGSIACQPDSYAQKAHIWDSSTLCISCAAPHTYGVFVSNWTLSASPCHQPDLRHLHGFYLSPAAFKPSHQLLPIFSQSKVDGYADILYPSPWNYIDKVKYDPGPDPSTHPDPPFAQKENTLFWRGATSEGVSRAGSWKGMTRQRLVHLSNNLTIESRSPTLPILLPHPSLPGKFTYQSLSTNPIDALNLSLNISIVGGIARAWDNDGAAQDAEFGFAPPTDFQEHWRYRYLFDMDGAGFSGRFLPFLQSRSLTFRTGIFRSWWDGRLVAWKHFVPVDVRLHGLFSTLAYFMGAASPTGSVEGIMKENLGAGEEIAEAGRVWAERVLRKEDMEIYMFRLLLEWGRLTDDRRDEIGFMG